MTGTHHQTKWRWWNNYKFKKNF